MLKRVLIANRGEIAIRIARAAAALGVESVSVHAPADALSLHTRATTLTRPYPGVAEGLAELARSGVGLAVCTNKPEQATRAVLDGLGLARFFPVVLGGDSLGARKPDPAPLLAALDRLGAAAGESAMVGDHRNDVLAARAAGTRAIFAAYGYGQASLGDLAPDATIDRFAELPDVLHTL